MNLSVNTPKNIDFLLIVRGLAAISVIYWHLGGYLIRNDYISSFFIVPGRLAVWIFFMMSGYLIGYGLIYGRYQSTFKGVATFWFNRLLRIYPIFITVSIVAIIAANPIVDFNFISRELLMVQWNHDYSLNGVFWTLGLETHFYLIAPLLVFGYQKIFNKYTRHWFLLYFTTLIILWVYYESSYFQNWDIRNILGGISQFAVGIALAGYKDQIGSIRNKKNVMILVAILTIFFILLFNHYYRINPGTIILSHIIGAGLIVLHILLEKEKKGSNFLIRVLMILGVLSYGVYAWHGLLAANGLLMDNLLLHASSAIILAYITYKIIEQPVLKWKKI